MITFNQIGNHGRLGNQIFQLASTIGIARKVGHEPKFPKDFDVPQVFNLKEDLLMERSQMCQFPQVSERWFHFDDKLFSVADQVDITGYLQTEKYFKHVEDEIRELLTFQDVVQKQADRLFPNVDTETVSIHVRRGDYVDKQAYHPLCTPEYYQAAINEFTDRNYHFVIFSDDQEYCKEFFGTQENILYIDNTNPFVDLCLMSMCNHNIIANSSFSWWAAWLNKNKGKKVIAPRQWFGPAYAHIHNNLSDLFCKDWIII